MRAVYDDDLIDVLSSLGLYKDFAAGRLRCAICGDTISWDNLNGIFPESGAVKVGCTRPDCVTGLIDRVSGHTA